MAVDAEGAAACRRVLRDTDVVTRREDGMLAVMLDGFDSAAEAGPGGGARRAAICSTCPDGRRRHRHRDPRDRATAARRPCSNGPGPA